MSSNKEEEVKESSDEEEYKTLLTHMKNLQPSAAKKIKKKTYELILTFVNEAKLSQRMLDLIIKGDRNQKIIGLCELCSKKNARGNFKESTNEIIKIIHDWMILSAVSETITTEFAINEEYVIKMNLGEHYSVLSNSTKKDNKQLAQKVLKIIKTILDKRPSLELSDLVRSGFIDVVEEALNQIKETEKKKEEEKDPEMEYAENMVDEVINTISMEPRTWEDVEKSGKKLLTVDFLSMDGKQFIDDEKEAEIELVDNFIDPLNNNAHLNVNNYKEEELQKLHIQMETFDPAFFLEKLYKTVTLDQFSTCLTNIDNNLQEINQRDETLIDKNIYKYLDCKKLLDSILQKFNNVTSNLMTQFNTQASSLKFAINDKLSNVKKSFETIIQSKLSKEIIMKFSKYFMMKDKIEHCLKFSNLEELADYLKKINVEIKDISQNRLIYGEFYDYFSKHIDNFKNILIEIIKISPMNEQSLKYFKYLLEFDVETDIIDNLINDQKTKMCDKIKNYLEFTDNLEIKNFKMFFCDEYLIENLPDEQYSQFLKEAESKLNQNTILTLNLNESLNNNEQYQPKKESVNVESIIKSLLKEINDFLFSMKVLDESLDLKPNYMQRDTKFDTIATEIYFVLFDKLKMFLFNTNFSMDKLIQDNYSSIYQFASNEYITKLLEFYNDDKELKNVIFNESFNKNSLQNLSNLIIEIFEKFEYHLSSDIINSLSENKNVIIEKIFIAFVNEKVYNTISFFDNENTIDFADTQISVFNYSSFTFTKNFFKILFKNFKNVIQFYMNIIKKIRIPLSYQILYLSFFLVVKCFVAKFITYYQTEKKYSTEDIKLNCLIVEALRNYNYIQFELLPILKYLFKNKEKDYQIYYQDLQSFINTVRSIFIDEYVSNAAENLLSTYINITTKVENTKYNFYEKYNTLLISNNKKNSGIFQDSRSVLIEMITLIANCIRDFDIINSENTAITNKEEENFKVIKQIIELFYDKVLKYAKENQKCLLCLYDEEEKQKLSPNILCIEPFKYISQLYLEFDIFNQIMLNYSSLLQEKENYVKETLITLLYKIKKISEKEGIDENKVYTKTDLLSKWNLVDSYSKNYSTLFKCFKHKS